LKRLRNIPRGDIAFEHTLHRMDAENDTGGIHVGLFLLSTGPRLFFSSAMGGRYKLLL